MSTCTLPLKLWSNPALNQNDEKVNVGDSWVIDPTGPILEPDECINAQSAPGVIKIYRDYHPDCLVIHWIFPNVHVGHILWVSQAPLRVTDFQIATVRRIERQLARNWERATRWESSMLPPPHCDSFESHWDLEKYTRPHFLPTVCRGRDQIKVIEQLDPETIRHYAELLERRKHEFTDLKLDLAIDRQNGIAIYTGNNGPRTYPLDKRGYSSICRALNRVQAYRRKKQQKAKKGA